MTSTDPYHLITGKNHPTDASVLEIAEHGRVGGVSTGEAYKKVGIVDGLPTDAGKNNPSTVLSYTGANLTAITETINGVQYRTTLTYDGSNVLTNISAAVQI